MAPKDMLLMCSRARQTYCRLSKAAPCKGPPKGSVPQLNVETTSGGSPLNQGSSNFTLLRN